MRKGNKNRARLIDKERTTKNENFDKKEWFYGRRGKEFQRSNKKRPVNFVVLKAMDWNLLSI